MPTALTITVTTNPNRKEVMHGITRITKSEYVRKCALDDYRWLRTRGVTRRYAAALVTRHLRPPVAALAVAAALVGVGATAAGSSGQADAQGIYTDALTVQMPQGNWAKVTVEGCAAEDSCVINYHRNGTWTIQRRPH